MCYTNYHGHAAEVSPSDLLESALSNFMTARKGVGALLNSSVQSQLLTDEKVCLCMMLSLLCLMRHAS